MNLPPWLIKRTPKQKNILMLRKLINDDLIHTVCESAKCPNIGECFSSKTATFMILGDICTRNCKFCGIAKGKPGPVDKTEPKRVAQAAKKLGLNYVVVTSVTRDDLPDKGAGQFMKTIRELKNEINGVKVEVLIPDMGADKELIKKIIDQEPYILNHNLEMAPRLYEKLRPISDYQTSLNVLKSAKEINGQLLTKSGFMLGLGESVSEVHGLLNDLRSAECDIVTIGQYLRPSQNEAEVVEYIKPERFEEYKNFGSKLGFKHVESGPFVRSSFNAYRLSHIAYRNKDSR